MSDLTAIAEPTLDTAAELAAHYAREAALRARNRAALLAALSASGISHVAVTYDGTSDSGQIEGVEAKVGDAVVALPAVTVPHAVAVWADPDPTVRDRPLGEVIEEIVYDLLDVSHGGWENGEGAYGEFVFDVAAGTVTLEHNERYTEIASTSYTF